MLRLEWVTIGKLRELRIQGELAAETVAVFEAVTAEVPSNNGLILDCAGLSFIDSTGTNALLMALLRWRKHGIAVELSNLADEIREMLEWLGLFEVLETAS